jgi:hypothetical protein
MKEALAHETMFPHIHPHAHFSAAQDLTLTFLFLCGVLAIGKLGIVIFRKLLRIQDRR